MQFRIGTNLHTALAVNAQENSPMGLWRCNSEFCVVRNVYLVCLNWLTLDARGYAHAATNGVLEGMLATSLHYKGL